MEQEEDVVLLLNIFSVDANNAGPETWPHYASAFLSVTGLLRQTDIFGSTNTDK